MLSRVANSIYWINRYMERAENYARFIDVNLNLSLDLPPDVPEQWEPLVKITGDDKDFNARYGHYSQENVIQFLALDALNPNSILSCLTNARENARTVREIISSEMWQQINEMHLAVQSGLSQHSWSEGNLREFLRTMKLGSHLFIGIMDSTYSHSEGYQFGRLGRFLERAEKTDRILDTKYFYLLPSEKYVGTPLDLLQWSALLKSASAFEAYRKTYGKLDIDNIIQFLILDRDFPRAVRYSVCEAQKSLHAVTGADFMGFSTPAGKALGKLRSELDYTEVEDIFKVGLHEYLDDLQKKINDVGTAIYQTFFDMTKDEVIK